MPRTRITKIAYCPVCGMKTLQSAMVPAGDDLGCGGCILVLLIPFTAGLSLLLLLVLLWGDFKERQQHFRRYLQGNNTYTCERCKTTVPQRERILDRGKRLFRWRRNGR